MKIAILSGKGGTGKTFVSVNLAWVEGESIYIDCDVEEPNGHLFLKPVKKDERNIKVMVPKIDHDICDGCRECVNFCEFNALAYINDKVRSFEEMCHSCGGCILVCPKDAISEGEKEIGRIEIGSSGEVEVYSGIMKIGQASGIPIIEEMIEDADKREDKIIFIDAPPGTDCSVMDTISDVDYCIVVGEDTLFGLHNFKMVQELLEVFNKPFGVVINKYLNDEGMLGSYCLEESITILSKIPYDEKIAYSNSKGIIASEENDEYKGIFKNLLEGVKEELADETVIDT